MAIYGLAYEALQYDGTNSAAILALAEKANAYAPWSIDSEGGGSLVLEFDQGGPDTVTITEGQFCAFVPHLMQFQVWPSGIYGDRFGDYESALVPSLALSSGSLSTPLLGASASTTLGVPLAPAQPSSAYEVAATLAGSAALLNDLEITAVAIVDADTVNVTVRNNGLVSLGGATVIVTAASVS